MLFCASVLIDLTIEVGLLIGIRLGWPSQQYYSPETWNVCPFLPGVLGSAMIFIPIWWYEEDFSPSAGSRKKYSWVLASVVRGRAGQITFFCCCWNVVKLEERSVVNQLLLATVNTCTNAHFYQLFMIHSFTSLFQTAVALKKQFHTSHTIFLSVIIYLFLLFTDLRLNICLISGSQQMIKKTYKDVITGTENKLSEGLSDLSSPRSRETRLRRRSHYSTSA